ncbi:pseudoazurin [Paenochrobactrum glaciei]|uniref:Pseudoazurin n=1 Tax=Paenochrobactrum glaciei TaxID=486407 RepID=A0ABN1G7F3_9HYPH
MKLVAALLVCLIASPALAETWEVKMYNRNEHGSMIYEPEYLKIAPGDSVKFVKTHPGHNAATIDGMIPEGAEPFKSKINEEDFTISLPVEGSYAIKCSPHYGMGMVMLIEVGENAPAPVFAEDMPKRARDRFEKIIAENRQ